MKSNLRKIEIIMFCIMVMLLTSCKKSDSDLEMVEIPDTSILIGKTEVTQELYEKIMGENPSLYKGKNRPVECVSWFDAIYFCNKLSESFGFTPVYSVYGETKPERWGYEPHNNKSIRGKITQNFDANGFRLPTLVEWRYAARGGQSFKYAGSDILDEVGWYKGNSGDRTHPVARKKENGYGLYDMSGNVWEWCWDVHQDYINFRCIRGGGYDYGDRDCEVVYRNHGTRDDFWGSFIGFRVVCSASE